MSDGYRMRNALAHAKETYAKDLSPRDIDYALQRYGYLCRNGTWARLMTNRVPDKHLVITLAQVFRCDLARIFPDQWFRTLDDCRLGACPDHPSSDHEQNGA